MHRGGICAAGHGDKRGERGAVPGRCAAGALLPADGQRGDEGAGQTGAGRVRGRGSGYHTGQRLRAPAVVPRRDRSCAGTRRTGRVRRLRRGGGASLLLRVLEEMRRNGPAARARGTGLAGRVYSAARGTGHAGIQQYGGLLPRFRGYRERDRHSESRFRHAGDGGPADCRGGGYECECARGRAGFAGYSFSLQGQEAAARRTDPQGPEGPGSVRAARRAGSRGSGKCAGGGPDRGAGPGGIGHQAGRARAPGDGLDAVAGATFTGANVSR